ncbi:MAG TPA: dienelactone hydrolase family protein [Alphaproteobacteria bacterium]|nr:dienelactone hydrolase family protein [Alphaproteobacteria bacterium]
MTNKIYILLFAAIFANLVFLNYTNYFSGNKAVPSATNTAAIQNSSSEVTLPSVMPKAVEEPVIGDDQVFTATSATETRGETVLYKDGDVTLSGYWVPANCNPGDKKKPTVIIIHQWRGMRQFEMGRADAISDSCYNAFALSMYPGNVFISSRAEAERESKKFHDADLRLSRIKAAVDYVKSRDDVDPANIAMIGYTFGGSMVLSYARHGADIKGVVAFHSSLRETMDPSYYNDIKAAIRVFEGGKTRFAEKDAVDKFKQEMAEKNVDAQVVIYPDAYYNFTDPAAGENPSDDGEAYSREAAEKSWAATLEFFKQIFGK